MTTHTPGPWEFVRGTQHRQKVFEVYAVDDIHGKPCKSILSASRPVVNLEANCHLIAAAPDLLEALKDATSCIAGISDGLEPPPDSDMGERLAGLLKQCSAAINKATA